MKLKGYIPGIDGLRAVAIISVIIYHMGDYLPGGFIGVDIFFVISGYVISRSLYQTREAGVIPYIKAFYIRRVKRVVPPLMITLFMVMLISTLFTPPFGLSRSNGFTGLSAFPGISNIILSLNLNSYFAPHIDYNPFAHTWSLGVELQFYLIAPFILYLIYKKGRKGIPGIVILLITVTISMIYSSVTTVNKDFLKSYYLLTGRFWELAAGSILFLLHLKGVLIAKRKVLKFSSSLAGLSLIIYGFFYSSQDVVLWALIPVTGTILLISGLIDGRGNLITTLFESNFMVTIGKLSYSLYLWHWPVAVMLRWTIGFETLFHKSLYILLSTLLAIISYFTLERRSRFNSSIKIVVAWGVLLFSSWFIDKNRESITLSITKNREIWRPWGFKPRGEDLSKEYPELKGKKIFIVGDSHAAAYRVMTGEVCHELGVGNIEFERGGYHVGNLLYPMSKVGDSEYYEELIKTIKMEIKPGDILFLASLRMPELSDSFEILNIDDVVENFFSNKAEKERKDALEELSGFIKEFEDLGVNILIDAPKPVLKAQPYRSSDWFNKDNPMAKPGITIDKELLLELRAPIMDSINTLQSRHKKLYLWDPFYILCENDGNLEKPLFFDGDHLTGHGNRVLVPSFKEKIKEIWLN